MASGPQALLLAGPTASGKSALAVRLAQAIGGIVVNADSMQVYADLRILTARPSEADARAAPHLLFGLVDAAENFSVARWLDAAKAALAEARARGATPIFVGGTGLYFKALTQGLSAIPAIPEDVRERLRARAAGLPPQALHEELERRDPVMAARLRPSDPQRLLRALEVLEGTGRSLSEFQGAREPPLVGPGNARAVFLDVESAALKARIDSRFQDMIAAGALEEARRLGARGLDPALPAMRAHGVPHLLAHLRGEIGLEEAIALGQRDTRAYARRQRTFARHQLTDFVRAAPDAAFDLLRAP
ncbi:tRNA (adenosine(37)-N6)-dimethylallyltransferase MiaA [Methylocella sp.]|uniref:tRNA (adenosine(37)-N6)-dimethylallyltransferase MiaA n=1 Tax=Methylocella sp. TaxID=1978226 RepID=UPI0035B42283